jgi:hypothetical protein
MGANTTKQLHVYNCSVTNKVRDVSYSVTEPIVTF